MAGAAPSARFAVGGSSFFEGGQLHRQVALAKDAWVFLRAARWRPRKRNPTPRVLLCNGALFAPERASESWPQGWGPRSLRPVAEPHAPCVLPRLGACVLVQTRAMYSWRKPRSDRLVTCLSQDSQPEFEPAMPMRRPNMGLRRTFPSEFAAEARSALRAPTERRQGRSHLETTAGVGHHFASMRRWKGSRQARCEECADACRARRKGESPAGKERNTDCQSASRRHAHQEFIIAASGHQVLHSIH